jgi:hypothetical protein
LLKYDNTLKNRLFINPNKPNIGSRRLRKTNTTGGCVNHFNSKNKSNDFALAAQLKLVLLTDIDKNRSTFAEYRYLSVDSTDYKFGSTVYAEHSLTNNWNLMIDSMGIHNGLVGVEYVF